MAGRAKGVKDPRIVIQDIEQWSKELIFSGVIVAEVHSICFGPCEVMLPTFQALMLDIDDAPSKLKFALVSVSRLEETQRQRAEKKQRELDQVQRRKANPADGDADSKEDAAHVAVAVTAASGDTSALSSQPAVVAPIPCLEKYSGYDHPRPLWVFIKDGCVIGEIRTAHPPRFRKVIGKLLAGSNSEFDPAHSDEIARVAANVVAAKTAKSRKRGASVDPVQVDEFADPEAASDSAAADEKQSEPAADGSTLNAPAGISDEKQAAGSVDDTNAPATAQEDHADESEVKDLPVSEPIASNGDVLDEKHVDKADEKAAKGRESKAESRSQSRAGGSKPAVNRTASRMSDKSAAAPLAANPRRASKK